MTTLEVVDSGESQAAVAYLLNLVMKRLFSTQRIVITNEHSLFKTFIFLLFCFSGCLLQYSYPSSQTPARL